MSTDTTLLLAQACNPLRADIDRRVAWDAFERESWFAAVANGRLRVSDLEKRFQESVYHLIVERSGT